MSDSATMIRGNCESIQFSPTLNWSQQLLQQWWLRVVLPLSLTCCHVTTAESNPLKYLWHSSDKCAGSTNEQSSIFVSVSESFVSWNGSLPQTYKKQKSMPKWIGNSLPLKLIKIDVNLLTNMYRITPSDQTSKFKRKSRINVVLRKNQIFSGYTDCWRVVGVTK